MNTITIDGYLAAQREDLQPALRQIRATIQAAAPTATERYAYRMPCYYIGKTFLCGFCLFKKHIGFYPGSTPIGVFAERLAGYTTSTGAVQLPLDRPVDHELLADIIRWRLENQGGK